MKIIAKNKKAKFNYQLLDQYEAGIVLKGWEIKSIRANHIDLKNAFITIKANELFLSNAFIKKYMDIDGDEIRTRKLLLHKNEIKRIIFKTNSQKLIIIPTLIIWKNQKIKVIFQLGKGLKKYDKRQLIKKRDEERMRKKDFF